MADGCDPKSGTDTFVEFISRIGNRIVYPSQWSVEDGGDHLILKSPDGRAIINIQTYTAEGSGSFEVFQERIASSLKGKWKPSEWREVAFAGNVVGRSKQLDPVDDRGGNAPWRIYAIAIGECFHTVLLNATSEGMALNGVFYENFLRSFDGIEKVPRRPS